MKHLTTLSLVAMSVLALTACKPKPVDTTAEPAHEMEGGTMKMSFRELMNLGDDYTCTFSETDEMGNKSEGTVYVESGENNMRGDFVITEANGETYEAGVIRAGTVSYIWTSDQPQGVKMTIEEDSPLFGTDEDGSEAGIDNDEPVDFTCEKWSPDSEMFEPPAEIEFLDMSAQMEMMEEQLINLPDQAEDENAQCAACDQVPDAAAKAQCKAALGC